MSSLLGTLAVLNPGADLTLLNGHVPADFCHSQNLVPNSRVLFFTCCFSLPAFSPFSGLWPALLLLFWIIITQSPALYTVTTKATLVCQEAPLGSHSHTGLQSKGQGCLSSVMWNIFLSYQFPIMLRDIPDENSYH